MRKKLTDQIHGATATEYCSQINVRLQPRLAQKPPSFLFSNPRKSKVKKEARRGKPVLYIKDKDKSHIHPLLRNRTRRENTKRNIKIDARETTRLEFCTL